MTVDMSRNILYTLSKGGSIEVYDLGGDGLSTNRVAGISVDYIVQRAIQYSG